MIVDFGGNEDESGDVVGKDKEGDEDGDGEEREEQNVRSGHVFGGDEYEDRLRKQTHRRRGAP